MQNIDPNLIGWFQFAVRAGINTFLPVLIWVPYCFIVSKKPSESAVIFYKKMRISSLGWRKIERETGLPSPEGEFKMNLIGWDVTSLALFGVLLGTGSLIFQQWTQAIIYLPIGIICSFFTWKIMSSAVFSSIAAETEEPMEP